MNEHKKHQIQKIIKAALEEDIGEGDITTNNIISNDSQMSGQIIAKETGIIAGLEVVRATFLYLDPEIKFLTDLSDGDKISLGKVIASMSGSGRAILSGERTALNFIQRMSGIATLTRKFVDKVQNTGAVILDTRKTVPGLRMLDKIAVKAGGGQNHRLGLFDMVLIKENHITAAGGIRQAVSKIRRSITPDITVELEVQNIPEFQTAIELKVDRIMMDNMNIDEIREAVILNKTGIPLEVSGNINLDNVAEFARTGVNYISVGQLTHSVKALDISLLFN